MDILDLKCPRDTYVDIFLNQNADLKLRREEGAEYVAFIYILIEENKDLQRRDLILTGSLPHARHCPRYMWHISFNSYNHDEI